MKNTRLQQARIAQGLTQQDLAERLSVHRSTVIRWEHGTLPEVFWQKKLCILFGMSPEELGFRTKGPEPEKLLTPDRKSIIDPLMPLHLPQLLIERPELLESMVNRLSAMSIVALHGLPGVGKTSLVQSFLLDPQREALFPDGYLWASLGPRPNIPELLSRWGALLGIVGNGIGTARTDEAWRYILQEHIGTRRLLIVIDDVWDTNDATMLKVGGPYCAYIATTRSNRLLPGVMPFSTRMGVMHYGIFPYFQQNPIHFLKKPLLLSSALPP